MSALLQTAKVKSIPDFCNLREAFPVAILHLANMEANKNGGPNYLKAWREFRRISQEELAARVKTTGAVISLLEAGERGLSAKWLRKLAPALETTPGLLLDHDPNQLDTDVVETWVHANTRQKRQIAEIATTIVRTGTDD